MGVTRASSEAYDRDDYVSNNYLKPDWLSA